MSSEASATKPRKREHLFKVLVIGELATGKTALVKRYVHNFFSDNYRATVRLFRIDSEENQNNNQRFIHC